MVMEEVGTQVAFMGRPSFAPRFCDPHPMPKKRSLASQPLQRPPNNWNPNHWEWDSSKFVATQRESPVDVQMQDAAAAQSQDLQLKLGGGGKPQAATSSLNSAEEAAARPSKKVRSGSPGTATYPMCQVDNCKEDLSHAKDYHRRHKVCELHSKASKALVANQMQRFCQQCSRFHPLTEFDEGKRSCRRRLAGHNKRRRKTQPEEATSRVVSSTNPEHHGQLNITNLLTVLAHAQAQVQGNTEDKGSNTLSMPDKDQLLQILTKINTIPLPPNLVAKLPTLSNQSRSVSNQSAPANSSPPNYSPPNGSSSPSTMNLLAALSGSAPHAPKVVAQERSSQGSDSEKTNSACSDQVTCLNLNSLNTPALNSLSVGERSSSCDQSPVHDSDCHAEEIHPNLPLQLFSSSPEDCYPPKIPAGRKYFSSDSSNPSEGRSPSYSPPIAQKLFPVHNAGETLKSVNISSRRYNDSNMRATEDGGCNTSLQLFAGSTQGADISSVQNSQYQAGYTSSSGSDHSPSSMNSDPQDRTGRIIFKLFDKDPSLLPGTLRKEIHSWLSNSPSEMESYIRPGCVMLSVYASMPLVSWEQFDEKLLLHLKSLIKDFSTDFWGTGRFLICTEKQLASHIDGKLRILKTPKAWCSPELLSVTPLAVVSGQETSLLLKGRNLNLSGTKVNCSHTVDYTMGDVSEQECRDCDLDAIMLCKFSVCASASSVFGRCFIEVENGLRVSSFPVIIADELICQELRVLEYEMGESSRVGNSTPTYHLQGQRRPGSRAEVLHFLNELGWLFQRKCNGSFLESPEYKISRFKFLLIFSVEHNFCFLVKSLLGILVEMNLDRESLRKESLEMVSEIHLLNRAVKRKFRSMIDLLLNYSVLDPRDGSRMYLFTPDLVGPGGVTPLHLAACTSRAEDMVDALTSDPQKIGLNGWKSLKDASGHSPFAYAAMSSYHSYNKLVGQKLSHEENRHVSVSVGLEIEQETNKEHGACSVTKRAHNSCSKCASAAMRYRRTPRSRGLLDRPYIHSMLAIAAVCVCVCLFLRGAPDCGLLLRHRAPFKWENLHYGTQ